jgi:hypothetical protein
MREERFRRTAGGLLTHTQWRGTRTAGDTGAVPDAGGHRTVSPAPGVVAQDASAATSRDTSPTAR